MACNSAIAVGCNRLYVFDENTVGDYHDGFGGMHCFRLTDDDSSRKKKERWSWRHMDDSTPISWSYGPCRIPFDTVAGRIAAYAVHPKGRTFFVSVWKLIHVPGGVDDGVPSTFSYSVESGVWTRRGDWMLPFVGHGHYDGELDSWVGLESESTFNAPEHESKGYTLVYDTKTAALTVVRNVPEALLMDCYSAAIAVGGNRLYVLDRNSPREREDSESEEYVNYTGTGAMNCFRLTDDGDGHGGESGWRWRRPDSTAPIS
uniref:Uncharacterized protein n=1 Tax=Oryza punctata TaxID=4537 RepID=A0A0E0LIQ7_ORYPU